MCTSLEIVKLVVSALTPIAVILLGVFVASRTRRIENTQQANRELTARRLVLFDKMAPNLNDLYCFSMNRGHFRDIEPPAAVRIKRDLDRLFFINEYLMSPDLASRYSDFIGACFQMWNTPGQDALLRASISRQRRNRGDTWSEEWTRYFTEEAAASSPEEIKNSYQALMNCFAREVGVRERVNTPHPGDA